MAYRLQPGFRRDQRRQRRHPTRGTMRILWEDESGHERPARAEIVDVSVSGLRLRLDERIPVRSYVSCNDYVLGIAGRGCVRHCNFVKGKYEIGIEFPGGTGWKEPAEETIDAPAVSLEPGR